MVARAPGTYAFFSSRNNNFSNRDQTGVVCVKKPDGSGCPLDAQTGVLQDANPMITVAPLPENPVLRQARARCFEEASAVGVATSVRETPRNPGVFRLCGGPYLGQFGADSAPFLDR